MAKDKHGKEKEYGDLSTAPNFREELREELREEPGEVTRALEEHLAEKRAIKDKQDEMRLENKKLNERDEYLDQLIITKLRAEGLTKVSSDKGTASIKHDQYPNIEDWDKAFPYIVANHPELISRAVKRAAWRELEEAGQPIPGIKSFEKDTLNFRRK